MAHVVVRLDDLLQAFRDTIEGARTPTGWDDSLLRAAVNEHFGFLGAFTVARIEVSESSKADDGDAHEVLILEFTPPENRDIVAAEQRFRRATREAESGRLRNALPELERLASEFPEVAKYHRALGQAHLVAGSFQDAEDSLLRSLSLDPADSDALTLLGNLYAKQDRPSDAVPLYERSVALRPNVYALNNLGAALAQLGDTRKAIETLRHASEVDPTYPNTWFGIGLALSRLEDLTQLPAAIEALDTCLRVTAKRETSPEVWDAARGLLDGLTTIESREEVRHAREAIRRRLSTRLAQDDLEVRVLEQALRGVLAKLEVGWVHGRDHHRLIVSESTGPEREHFILHELEHLNLIEAARAATRNRWFVSTPPLREKALRSMNGEITKIAQRGFPHATIVEVTTRSLDGLLGQLFNFPIDLLIETRLLATYADCRELIYRSLKSQLDLAASIAHNKDLKNATPRSIFRANSAMNGAFALWFEDQFPNRTEIVQLFQKTDSWPIARRLYATWKADSAEWTAGAEYTWIDSWAGILGIRDWYTWTSGDAVDDDNPSSRTPATATRGAPDEDAVRDAPQASPTLGPSGPLDGGRATAAMFFMLGAMEWAERVSTQDVARVAASAALIGQNGIAYMDPESRYELPGYSAEPISGLQLLSVMYVAIKQIEPTLDQGIDLDGPYDAARDLFHAKKRRTD